MSNGVNNKRLKILAVLLLLPMSVLVPVLSIDGHNSPDISVNAQSDRSLEQRKQEYRREITQDLNRSEEQRIIQRCNAVQTNLKVLNERLVMVKNNRTEAYDSILEQLNSLTQRLNDQAYETSQLEANIDTLTGKVTTFKNGISSYQQTVEDLTKINCQQEPDTFQAALIVARRHHAGLIPQAGDIRGYVVNTIKPTLFQIRGVIEDGQTTGGIKQWMI